MSLYQMWLNKTQKSRVECLTHVPPPKKNEKPREECLTHVPPPPSTKMTWQSKSISAEFSLPQHLQMGLAGVFKSYKTCGDGACAIHAVFGTPDRYGEYKRLNAREFYHTSLGGNYDDFKAKVEDKALLDRWRRNVWLDMVRPSI